MYVYFHNQGWPNKRAQIRPSQKRRGLRMFQRGESKLAALMPCHQINIYNNNKKLNKPIPASTSGQPKARREAAIGEKPTAKRGWPAWLLIRNRA